MAFYGGKELAASFRQVRANTIQVAQDIPEDKYTFKPTPESRTVAQLLAHIAAGPTFQLHIHVKSVADLAQVNFGELMQQIGAIEAPPRTKAELVELLKVEGERFASFVAGLGDDFLAQPVAMPPGASPATKSRLEMLLSSKEHEMHHRGQLMLVERMLGITPHLTRLAHERVAAHAAATSAR